MLGRLSIGIKNSDNSYRMITKSKVGRVISMTVPMVKGTSRDLTRSFFPQYLKFPMTDVFFQRLPLDGKS
jgi:hypothetical protein